MYALFSTLDLALNVYGWILIVSAVFSWLYAFNVINQRNQVVNSIGNCCFRSPSRFCARCGDSARPWRHRCLADHRPAVDLFRPRPARTSIDPLFSDRRAIRLLSAAWQWYRSFRPPDAEKLGRPDRQG